ncbi:protein export protein SecD, putative [Mycobacterium lentiflavum]|uniref:Preprotein translocase subunit SecD n=1 Tax=Mycobacterium lentiflavum TaxID=141349 RepID=A0A0E3WCF5_MYCLN|nr:preprotein translocase subunit SecD [Mycobacterium lentiflavum]MEE3066000.1 preprotein translocase subunit SecD [Actinomycetota bacterium]ULP44782.1 preprotein translocase subunit SecD [Mycobacterium lentiflavum]CQD13902.1 protein export protein SecD, putative [Mycobacterium lentiflavum]
MPATATVRLTSAILLGVLACGCHTAQHAVPTAPTSTVTSAPPPIPQVVRIAPLPVRPVEKSQPASPDKCPPTNPAAPAPPDSVLVTCDLARTTRYTLGPETMRLELTHVDAPKPLTADFYQVTLTMDPASETAWAAFTAAHLHAHVAFIRDDLVLEAPMIEDQVSFGQIALTTQTAPAAAQLAQLASRPA